MCVTFVFSKHRCKCTTQKLYTILRQASLSLKNRWEEKIKTLQVRSERKKLALTVLQALQHEFCC